jgi:hypothetical protein
MTFYHGTSVAGLKVILPPSYTGNLREDFRKGFRDCVFVTPSKKSAIAYAWKSVAKLGGQPVVYEVKPINPSEINVSQCVCDKALVLRAEYL